MKRTFPVFAALALGLAVPASAQEAPPPPPADPAAAVEEPAPPPPEAGAESGESRRERRRPGAGPRREGAEGADGPRRDGPGRFGPAGAGRGGPGMNEGGSIGFIVPLLQKPETAARIGLPEEKAQALAAAFADLDAQLKAVNEKLPGAFKRQADALEAETPDEAAVLAAVNEVWDLRREVALLQTRKVLAIRTSLTAEQIDKARALLREDWRERRGEGGMRRGPGDRGPGAPGGRRGPRPGDAPAEEPRP